MLVRVMVETEDVSAEEEEVVAHIHLSAYEGVHIQFPDVVILLGAVVYIQVVCVEGAEGVVHIHLSAYEGVHI
jgi:hypothetical protein